MIFLNLFWAFFQIGLFSIGGGYAALPLIQNQVVQIHGWLNMGEFADVITISQMTPGPIAINAATFGCILPSFLIVLLFAYLYKKYKDLHYVQGVLCNLQPAVIGMIAAAGISIIAHALWSGELSDFSLTALDWVAIGIMSVCIFLLRRFKLNPIFVMLGAGVAGGLIYSIF